MIVTINGSEVDVLTDGAAPSFQSNTLNEIQNRNLPNARLKFPKTPKNVIVFDFLGFQGSTSAVPYRLTDVVIREGDSVVLKGKIKITKVTDEYYEGIAKGEGGDLFDLTKDKDLSDLDFSDINHYLNNTTYADGVDNTDGHVYAVANYTKEDGIQDPLEVATQSPSLFKHYLWDKIFSEAGVTYSGDLFSTTSFKSEVISMAKGHVGVGKAYKQKEDFEEQVTTSDANNGTYAHNTRLEKGDLDYSDERVLIGNNGEMTFLEPCKLRVSCGFGSEANYQDESYVLNYAFFIKKNGIVIDSASGSDLPSSVFPFNASSGTTTIDSYMNIEAGDVVTLDVESDVVITFNASDLILIQKNAFVDVNFEILEPYIDFSELIGGISQTAFIKDVIKTNGLMFRVNNALNYEFVTMESILTDRANAEDWSDKVSGKVTATKSIGGYGLRNKFRYEYLEGVTPFLDYTHVSTNENQSPNATIIQSIYGVSSARGSFLGSEVLNPVMFELIRVEELEGDEGEQYLARVNEYQKPLEIKNRTSKVESRGRIFDIIDGNEATVSLSVVLSRLVNEDVQWSFYKENYFKAFLRILDEPSTETMEVYLTSKDIADLDFFKLKYFAHRGAYYYLNKVSKYIEGYNTKCEFVKVINE